MVLKYSLNIAPMPNTLWQLREYNNRLYYNRSCNCNYSCNLIPFFSPDIPLFPLNCHARSHTDYASFMRMLVKANRKYHTEIDARLVQELGVSNGMNVFTGDRWFQQAYHWHTRTQTTACNKCRLQNWRPQINKEKRCQIALEYQFTKNATNNP